MPLELKLFFPAHVDIFSLAKIHNPFAAHWHFIVPQTSLPDNQIHGTSCGHADSNAIALCIQSCIARRWCRCRLRKWLCLCNKTPLVGSGVALLQPGSFTPHASLHGHPLECANATECFERCQRLLWRSRISRPAHGQYNTSKLSLQVLFLHIMAILHLPPSPSLPDNLLTTRLGSLFDTEPSQCLSSGVSQLQIFTPFADQSSCNTQTFAS